LCNKFFFEAELENEYNHEESKRAIPRMGKRGGGGGDNEDTEPESDESGSEDELEKRAMPRMGRAMPRMGRAMPRMGRAMPRMGRAMPRMGRANLPRMG
jgi:hypothetical protein